MPEGCIALVMGCAEEHRSELKALLTQYKDVFPTALPKRVPSNRGLGDEKEINL